MAATLYQCLLCRTLFNDISSVANHFCQKSLVSSRRERTQQAILKVNVNGKKTLLQVEKKVSNSFRASMGEIRVFDWFARSIRDVSDNGQMHSNMSAKTMIGIIIVLNNVNTNIVFQFSCGNTRSYRVLNVFQSLFYCSYCMYI